MVRQTFEPRSGEPCPSIDATASIDAAARHGMLPCHSLDVPAAVDHVWNVDYLILRGLATVDGS